VIRILWSDGVQSSEFRKRISAQYGNTSCHRKGVLLLQDNDRQLSLMQTGS
jgi:hypothetical protein